MISPDQALPHVALSLVTFSDHLTYYVTSYDTFDWQYPIGLQNELYAYMTY